MQIWKSVIAVLMLAGSLQVAGSADDVTTIAIGDKVLVPDTQRLGINLGGDNYYSGAALVKKRVGENFEGTTYRQCYWGPAMREDGLVSWFSVADAWKPILIGAKYTILSGPDKGATGVLKDVGTTTHNDFGKERTLTMLLLDRKMQQTTGNVGLMVEAMRLEEGSFRPLDGHWTSKNNKIVTGDVPKGSFGCAALDLDASSEPAHVRFGTHYQQYGQLNGIWRLSFWARQKSGEPSLSVGPSPAEYGQTENVALTPEWKKHELKIPVNKVPEPQEGKTVHLTWLFSAKGGEVLLDDVEAWMEGDTNPTAFRDDCVATLKKFNPGMIRNLQMGGNTVANTIATPLRAHAFTSQHNHKPGPYATHNRLPYSLHELYELCEYIGAEPWYCLPGTLNEQEIRDFMEYLGAPADVGYGKLRAQLGHPKPWTEVFKRIHVEFGNEAWNNAIHYQCGGYNGPDYWRDLIAAGKASPHYKPVVLFHAAGQAANANLNARIMKDAPNADRFSVAPYVIHNFSKEEAAALDSDDKLFRWALAWPILRSRDEKGTMRQNFKAAQAAKMELSIYEFNHHITGGDGPLEPRNRLATSLGGGLNIANAMLLMLKEHQLRAQCFFTFIQHSYKAQNVGEVRLWGAALNMRKDLQRHRPTFLACELANKIIGGDLIETTHTGANPVFSATGVFAGSKEPQTVEGLPALWSYAFKDGKRCGLILVNLDTAKSREVALQFSGAAAGNQAQVWTLAAEKITANNEFENPQPEVLLKESRLDDFRSGRRLTLPPHSMHGFVWQTQ